MSRHRAFGHESRNVRPNPEEQIERDPSLIEDARDAIATMDLPGQPNVRDARYIATSLPHWCGSRKVLDIHIRGGEPLHGEKRSDDHISTFEVRAPLSDFDVVGGHECPSDGCFETNAVYSYNAYHHIAGSESVVCPECDHVYFNEEWG